MHYLRNRRTGPYSRTPHTSEWHQKIMTHSCKSHGSATGWVTTEAASEDWPGDTRCADGQMSPHCLRRVVAYKKDLDACCAGDTRARWAVDTEHWYIPKPTAYYILGTGLCEFASSRLNSRYECLRSLCGRCMTSPLL